MPKFSEASANKLRTCHPDLQRLFNEVIKHYDCIIICGSRSDFDQMKAFREGKSKLDGVKKRSMHQVDAEHPLSRAVDAAPSPLDWNDKIRFYHFIGFVEATAKQLNIQIRSGSDWDRDHDFKDNAFSDLPHYEILS